MVGWQQGGVCEPAAETDTSSAGNGRNVNLAASHGQPGILSWRTVIFAAALVLLLDAKELFAWGPATHVQLANDVLRNLGLLPAAVAALLGRHAVDYIYGCVAADVVFAKRLSRIKQSCHHWSTGFGLLKRADSDRGRAFAYGYLSHLAADTVAHGKFVPRQIMLTRSTVSFGHVYWEMRADQLAPESAPDQLRAFSAYNFDVHHRELSGMLLETFLPYQMNREVFARINALVGREGWRRGMEIVNRCSRWALHPDILQAYHGECVDRTLSLLAEEHRSPVLAEDPNGSAALACSRINRRQLRRLKRRGLPWQQRAHELAAGWAPQDRLHPWAAVPA